MEKTVRVLNCMKEEGIVADYAIGGAVAALFYMEPVLTYDLDVFVRSESAEQPLGEISAIFSWLEKRGYQTQGEHVEIEGIPVQFLPANRGLLREALDNSREIPFRATTVRVVAPEFLAAIMLQTGRSKDRERLLKFLDEAEIDGKQLQQLIERYRLKKAWQSLGLEK